MALVDTCFIDAADDVDARPTVDAIESHCDFLTVVDVLPKRLRHRTITPDDGADGVTTPMRMTRLWNSRTGTVKK